jgi:hypothetical protein
VQWWMVVLGALVLLGTSLDALTTTIAPAAGGGWFTSRVARGLHWSGERLARRPAGIVERALGPTVAVSTVASWLLGIWLGWFLVFSAAPDAVVSEATGAPSDGWTRLYYAGFTVFTLGVGDHAPGGSSWQVATVLGTASGLVFTTLAITFLVPVVTAVTQRRQQACRIASLGADAQAIVINGWHGSGFGPLERILPDLASDMLLTAERRLAYPILAYFYAAAPADDHRIQLAAIDEAATILRRGVDPEQIRVPPLALHLVRHAVVQQLERATMPVEGHPGVDPFDLDLTPLREAGIPTVSDEAFAAALAEDEDHRRRLAELVASTGWDPSLAARTRGA